MRRLVALVSLGMLLVGCAEEARPSDDGATVYRADAFVLEDATHGPELCVGGIADSYPPQCEGLRLEGWDWDAVEGEDEAQGARWGQFEVWGTYDGITFTVLEAGPPGDEGPRGEPTVWTRCPEPEGGWVAVDASIADMAAIEAVGREIRDDDDYAGHWVDHVGEPSETVEPGGLILNVAFTGDLERREAEIRELWGGPLCLQEHERTMDELKRIQRELGDPDVAAELGLQITWSGIRVVDNLVDVGVVVAPPQAEAALAERYGAGAVELFPELVPVD